jgi:hypothetical protein
LTEFRVAPAELTDRLYALTEPLAVRVAGALARDAGLIAAPAPILGEATSVSTAPVTAMPPEAYPPPPVTWPDPSSRPSQPPNGLPTH